MVRGLPASIFVHVAVFGASYLTLPYWTSSARVYATDFEVVDVNFAEIGEVTNIAPLIENEPEEPEEAAPEEPEDIPEEPPVEEELPETEQDVSNVEDTPAAAEDPAEVLPDFEKEDPEDTPEPEPEPPAEERQRPQNDLMDFLNQSETTFKSEQESRAKREDTPPPPPEDPPVTALKDAPKPAEDRNRRGAGERNGNTARLETLIVSRIRNECWSGVDDLPNPERYNVHMNLKLNENGSIAELTLVDPRRRPIGSSFMGTAVDRALRAVRKCAPYRLPSDEYELWREINVKLGQGFTDG